MKILKLQKGFTLVEILVVMAIIAMLSTLAVNGYLSYRRSALLDLSADNLVSQINAMKAKATYGTSTDAKYQEIKKQLDSKTRATVDSNATRAVENLPKCYGISFEKSVTGDTFNVNSFAVDFVNTKVWNTANQSWGYQGCNDSSNKDSKLSLDLDSQMKILSIAVDGNSAYDKLTLRFLPPDGKLEVVGVADDAKILKILLSYGGGMDLNYQREVDFNLANAKATVNKIETTNVK